MHSYFLCLCHCWSCWCLCQSEVLLCVSEVRLRFFSATSHTWNVREAQNWRSSEGPFPPWKRAASRSRDSSWIRELNLKTGKERIAVSARHWMLRYKLFLIIMKDCFLKATAVRSWRDWRPSALLSLHSLTSTRGQACMCRSKKK